MRSLMMTVACVLVAVLALAGNALAAGKQDVTGGRGMKPIDQVREILDKMTLTDEQKTEVKGVLSEAETKIQDARAEAKKSGDKQALKQKVQEIVKQAVADLKPILTADQYKELVQKLKEARKAGKKTGEPTTKPAK
ncbi:MAG: hypothetical protein QM770_20135 [Tepidisphaeraceae bacterium]